MRRKWWGRIVECSTDAYIVRCGTTQFVPMNPMRIAGKGEMYTSSVGDIGGFIRDGVENILKGPEFPELQSTQGREDCMGALQKDKGLCDLVRHTISDTVTSRKKNARDTLFQRLGYTWLPSRQRAPVTPSDKDALKKQIREVREKFQMNGSTCMDYSAWRTRSLGELRYSESDVVETSTFVRDTLFANSVAEMVLRSFMGYDVHTHDGTTPVVDTSIIVLCRLDAWIATTVECLQEERGRGGARIAQFKVSFCAHLPRSTSSILRCVGEKAQAVHADELTAVAHSGSLKDANHTRVATK